MAKTEQFSQLYDVLHGQHHFGIVDEDGIIDCGRCYNVTPGSSAPQIESLSEVHNDRGQTVRTIVLSETFPFSFAIRDLTSAGRTRLLADGAAPTIDTVSRLMRFSTQGHHLIDDRKSGDPRAYRLPDITGLPQAYNATVFPAATSVVAVEGTSGSFAADDYYVWVVPVYRDEDLKHGPTDANFTLANWANLTRGVEYVYGTPAQHDGALTVAANKQIGVTFDEPTIAEGVAQPTHFAIVVGTVDDIEDADSHVAAIEAWSGAAHSVDIDAVGTVDFGNTPVVADYVRVETGVVTADVRVWTAEVEDTDYTVDRVNDTITRVDGGDISDAELVRVNVWYIANPTDLHKAGGQGTGERYEWLRIWNFSGDTTDPDTRQIEGVQIDLPRVNTAALTRQVASAAKDGFHDPIPFSGAQAEYDSTQGCSVLIKRFSKSNVENVDWAGDDITPAGA